MPTPDDSTTVSEPSEKKQKHSPSDDVLERLNKLEESSRDTVGGLRDKVRMLASQANPSDALLLLTIEELARTSRKLDSTKADTYEELSRQAFKHEGSINLSSLALSVIGSKASEDVVKALSKCVKEKQIEEKLNAKKSAAEVTKETTSPLAHLYPPVGNQLMLPGQPMWPGSGYGTYYGYNRPTRMAGRGLYRPRGHCYSCDSVEHNIKDCPKMKAAKSQNK